MRNFTTIFLFTLLIVSCNGRAPSKGSVNAIANIDFGISPKEFNFKRDSLLNTTQQSPDGTYTIGVLKFRNIIGEYYKNKLYSVTIYGYNYAPFSHFVNEITKISKVFSEKYGEKSNSQEFLESKFFKDPGIVSGNRWYPDGKSIEFNYLGKPNYNYELLIKVTDNQLQFEKSMEDGKIDEVVMQTTKEVI